MLNKTPSRIRRGLAASMVGAALLLMPFGGTAKASSMTCDPEIQDACIVAGTVICKVVAKGRPCLM